MTDTKVNPSDVHHHLITRNHLTKRYLAVVPYLLLSWSLSTIDSIILPFTMLPDTFHFLTAGITFCGSGSNQILQVLHVFHYISAKSHCIMLCCIFSIHVRSTRLKNLQNLGSGEYICVLWMIVGYSFFLNVSRQFFRFSSALLHACYHRKINDKFNFFSIRSRYRFSFYIKSSKI